MRKISLAEQEAKINLLRERARVNKPQKSPTTCSETSTTLNQQTSINANEHEHVNFFSDVEAGKYISTKDNADRVEEKKQEQEKYEKQIGYLTYLGQDTNEINKTRNWYDRAPDRTEKFTEDGKKIEATLKSKLANDPLMIIQRYVGTSGSLKSEPKVKEIPDEQLKRLTKYESIIPSSLRDDKKRKKKKRKRSCSDDSERRSKKKKSKKKHKKEKKSRRKSYSSSESSSDEEAKQLQKQKIEKLRRERLERERVEKEKADNLLKKLRGETIEPEKKVEKPQMRQKYNSQFNPDIARQNQDQ